MAGTQIKFSVTLADGVQHEVVATDRDVIALEEHFDIDASVLPLRQRMVWLAYLAWSALSHKGLVDAPFDEWKRTGFALALDDTPGNA